MDTSWKDGKARTFGRLNELKRLGPGTVVEIERLPGQLLLIGDVNEVGGVCEDCSLLVSEDVVLRYRHVDWKTDE